MSRVKRMLDLTSAEEEEGQAMIRPKTRKRTLQDVGHSMQETLIELCRSNHIELATTLVSLYDTELMLMYHNYEFYRVAAAEGHTRLLNAFNRRLDAVLHDKLSTMEEDWLSTEEEELYVSKKKPRYFRYLAFEEACRYGHLGTAQFIHEVIRHDHGNVIGKNSHCLCSDGTGFVLLDAQQRDTGKAVFSWGEQVDVHFHIKGKQVAMTECQDAGKRAAICNWINSLDVSDHGIPSFNERVEYNPRHQWKCTCLFPYEINTSINE